MGDPVTADKQTDRNRIGAGKPGPGRPKGSQNKATKALKDMILGALDGAGGEEYLRQQAQINPTAFMTLLGKVLPTQLSGEGGGAVRFELLAPWLKQNIERRNS